ncbi:S8 family serine peptidase [Sphingobium sp. Sx8-8]|uniref:S8 family peptidase n=1 Tax=Sphingobium sp. Sx8-8 TaxID=2933617 RepID=UPI001F58CB69|nr:S8 family serine peptidase [Sphingobium sp. Sx8-8]
MDKQSIRRRATGLTLAPFLLLAACGGGGGVQSAPAPTPTATPTPTPAPSPTPAPVNYDTAEFRRSTGPSQHGALAAYNAGASGAGVTVGIIDSGIARSNSEFAGRISPASADFAGNGSIEDQGGHGTAVATVLAAARDNVFVQGMAWGSTILALRTDTPGSCTGTGKNGCAFEDGAISQALDHARTNGARVVNISLGGDSASQGLLDAVSRATAAGIIIVVSAGNDGQAAPDAFAASFSAASVSLGLVIIAGSVNAANVRSSFSNAAQGFEGNTLFALGESVLSQDQTGAHFLYDGTSFSAPQIAGAAALLAQAFPALSGAQIVDLLLSRATDAGAAGTDSVYGRGILNIAAAFAPQGATSLAGSAVPVSVTSNASLSSAMGDAGGTASASAVMIDRLGRAYRLDIGRTLTPAAQSLTLTPSLLDRRTHVALDAGPATLSLSLAPARIGPANPGGLALPPDPQARSRPMSGSIALSLNARTRVMLGLSESADRDSASAPGDFLVARSAAASPGFDRIGMTSLGVRTVLGPGLALMASMESGRVMDHEPVTAHPDRRDRYAMARFGWEARGAAFDFHGGLSLLREENSVLGARFGPALGAGAGTTLFVDMGATFDAGSGWTLAVGARHGWTRATALRLQGSAWSLDAGRDGLLGRHDRFALRLSQPLRVDRGGLDLLLPVSYDYASGTALMERRRLSLAPQGRQIDAEASYGLPAAGGWLGLNSYWRRQGGNIAAMPDEIGAALRYNLDF